MCFFRFIELDALSCLSWMTSEAKEVYKISALYGYKECAKSFGFQFTRLSLRWCGSDESRHSHN